MVAAKIDSYALVNPVFEGHQASLRLGTLAISRLIAIWMKLGRSRIEILVHMCEVDEL